MQRLSLKQMQGNGPYENMEAKETAENGVKSGLGWPITKTR
jgi:hypothetical protein